jgi:hypothetical protein
MQAMRDAGEPLLPPPQFLKKCQVGVKWKKQREALVMSALALQQQFSVNRDVLKRVKGFKYLGCLLAQDDDDIQAIRACEIIGDLVYYLVPRLHTVYRYWYPATILSYLRTCLLLVLKPLDLLGI